MAKDLFLLGDGGTKQVEASGLRDEVTRVYKRGSGGWKESERVGAVLAKPCTKVKLWEVNRGRLRGLRSPHNSPGARKGESPSDFLFRLLRMVAGSKVQSASCPKTALQAHSLKGSSWFPQGPD